MTRKEIYSHIQGDAIKQSIKEYFGKNFTQVSSECLIEFLELDKKSEPKEELKRKNIKVTKLEDNSYITKATPVEVRIVTVLKQKGLISEGDVDYILNTNDNQ